MASVSGHVFNNLARRAGFNTTELTQNPLARLSDAEIQARLMDAAPPTWAVVVTVVIGTVLLLTYVCV